MHPTVALKEAMSDSNMDVIVVGMREMALLKIVNEEVKEAVLNAEIVQTLDEYTFQPVILLTWPSTLSDGASFFPS